MYLKYLILFCVLISTLTSISAQADPVTGLITAYMKQKDMREIKGKLAQIEKDLEGIKNDINLIIDSDLKAAMSALNDAKEMVNPEEKADSIRSAKHFLTRAVNISKEPDRKALAYYILGHVYLLLNEETAAKSQFKKVVQFKYGTTTGLWNKETSYNKAITRLKRDASGILCTYQEVPKKLNENWCALHVGYLNASKIELGDLEDCLHTENKANCERVGYDLLQQYLSEHEKAQTEPLGLQLVDPFSNEHNEAIGYSKNFLYEGCEDPSKLSSQEHFKACFRRGQVLFHEGKFSETLKHYHTVCDYWFRTLKPTVDEDDPLSQIGQEACQSIYRDPLWTLMGEGHKFGIVKDLCLEGDLQACGQMIKDKHFYHADLLSNISSYVADRCLLQEEKSSCELIDQTQSRERKSSKFVLNKVIVGLTPEGKLWDLTGDSNPEVLLKITVGELTVYHQELGIAQITSDAFGNPLTYELTLEPKESLLIDQLYAAENTIRIVFSDRDPMSDDLIGEFEMKGGLQPVKTRFGSLSKIDLEVK